MENLSLEAIGIYTQTAIKAGKVFTAMPVKRMRLAELINGRAAMFGCSAIGMSTLATKKDVINALVSPGLQ